MTQQTTEQAPPGQSPAGKVYSKKDVVEALEEISKRVVDSHAVFLHSMLLLDYLMRLPNANELFDEELKVQARELWIKVKSAGLHLAEPPLLFGAPATPAEKNNGA